MRMRVASRRTKPTELYDIFRNHADTLGHPAWIARAILPFCVCEKLGRPLEGKRVRMLQHPEEFAQFMVYAARKNVRSYLEIGVHSGGSFYIMDSYLRATVPNYRGGVAIDATDKNLIDWSEYKERFPSSEFRKTDSQKLALPESEFYDLSFIDGSHVERAVRKDFESVRDHCRIVAFHDICSKKPGVRNVWTAIRDQYLESLEYFILTRRLREMRGIGVATGLKENQ